MKKKNQGQLLITSCFIKLAKHLQKENLDSWTLALTSTGPAETTAPSFLLPFACSTDLLARLWLLQSCYSNQLQLSSFKSLQKLSLVRCLKWPHSDYLQTVFIGSTYVGQTVNVERQPLRHGEHLNRESAPLRKTINREPVECLINGTAGNKAMSPFIPDTWLGIKVNCTEVIKLTTGCLILV